MNSDLITALFGLAGVVIGASITTVTTWKLDDRRNKIADKKESEAKAIELQRAARLVFAEFITAVAFTKHAQDLQEWWTSQPTVSLDEWREHRSVLATNLPTTDWVAVSTAAIGIQHLLGLQKDLTVRSGENKIPREALDFIVQLETAVVRGRDALAKFT